MKLLKAENGPTRYLYDDEGTPKLCPFQDSGSTVRINQGQQLEVVGKPKDPVQEVTKTHLPCGTWCALFHTEPETLHREGKLPSVGCKLLCSGSSEVLFRADTNS